MNATTRERFLIPSRTRRVLAYVYDALPLLAVLFLAAALALVLTGGEAVAPGNPLYQLWLFAWILAYFVVSWTFGGQTVGMRAWKLHLVKAEGGALEPSRMVLRFVLALAGWAALGVGHLWLAYDPQRRGLHDVLCGTLIVQEEPRPRRGRRAG